MTRAGAALVALGVLALQPERPATADIWVDDTRHVPARASLFLRADGITLSGMAFARARVWTLVGEPVVYCDVAIGITNANLPIAMNRVQQREAIEAVTLLDANLRLSLAMAPQIHVDCDAGALGRPFMPTPADFRYDTPIPLTDPKLRIRYVSFNVPGSPSWDRFLYKLEGPQRTKKYLSADAAKATFKRYANTKHRLPLQGFRPLAVRMSNAYTVELDVSVAAVHHLQFTNTVAATRAEQARFEATQRVREEQRRKQLASQRPATPPTTANGTRVVGQQDPFWSLPASVATPQEQAKRTDLAKRLAEAERRTAEAARKVAEDAARVRSRASLGDPVEQLRARCTRSRDAYAACVQRTCGADPGPYTFGRIMVASFICKQGGPPCAEQREEHRRREAEADRRHREEHRRRADRYRSCELGARSSCAGSGTHDVEACIKQGWDP